MPQREGTCRVDERPNPQKPIAGGRTSTAVVREDDDLVERVQRGETEVYGDLVRKYQDRLFNTCWRICGHLEDARDLTQEAFLKAFENLDRFHRKSGFYTWLFRVAVNLALSHRRAGRRRRTTSLDQGTGPGGTQAESLAKRVRHTDDNDPATATGDAELQGAVVRALQALDDDHRAVVVLRDIEGLDYRQIGEILEIPPGTVRSRLHRARTTLRSAIIPSHAPETQANEGG